MSHSSVSPLLRTALVADAAMTGAAGLLMAVLPGTLGSLLEIPETLLLWAGVSLLPFVAFLIWVARQPLLSRPAVVAVIICNALWTAGSVVLLLSGWIAPNLLGQAFIVMQALAVGIFAELQFLGLRRSMATKAA